MKTDSFFFIYVMDLRAFCLNILSSRFLSSFDLSLFLS